MATALKHNVSTRLGGYGWEVAPFGTPSRLEAGNGGQQPAGLPPAPHHPSGNKGYYDILAPLEIMRRGVGILREKTERIGIGRTVAGTDWDWGW